MTIAAGTSEKYTSKTVGAIQTLFGLQYPTIDLRAPTKKPGGNPGETKRKPNSAKKVPLATENALTTHFESVTWSGEKFPNTHSWKSTGQGLCAAVRAQLFCTGWFCVNTSDSTHLCVNQ